MGDRNLSVQAENDPFDALTSEKWKVIVRHCRRDGKDHYQAAAAFMFGVLYENVNHEQRQIAKRYTFPFRFSKAVAQERVSMPKGKTDPFAALAEQLIRDAEAVPVPLDIFVDGLERIVELVAERVSLSRAEAFRGSAETNKT